MPSGTVKSFDAARGFGFIVPDDGGHDVFVHISAVKRAGIGELLEGASVTFDLILNHHGKPVADNLKTK
jgi:cold shock protein